MGDAATMERAAPHLPIAPLATALPRATQLRLDPSLISDPLPGELACAQDWLHVADLLDRVADSIPRRMARRGDFSAALAAFIAKEVRQSAAEIRANLALEEHQACVRACRYG